MRWLFAFCLTLLLSVGALHSSAMLLPRGGAGSPSVNSLSTLANLMTAGQTVRLTNATNSGNWPLALEAETCANFDGSTQIAGHAADFCTGSGTSPCNSDCSIIGGGYSYQTPWGPFEYGQAFCRDAPTAKCAITGGGHSGSGDNGFYTFDLNAAAAAILGSSSGGNWALAIEASQYVNCGTSAPAPCNWHPAWNPMSDLGQGGLNTPYINWLTPDGKERIIARHIYNYGAAIPGTFDWVFGESPLAVGWPSGEAVGGYEVLNDQTGSSAVVVQASGHAGWTYTGVNGAGGALNPDDSCMYINAAGGAQLGKVCNLNTTPVYTDYSPDFGINASACGVENDALGRNLIIPDPIHGAPHVALFQDCAYFGQPTQDDQFTLYTEIDQGSSAINPCKGQSRDSCTLATQCTFESAASTTGRDDVWDSSQNKIALTDGVSIFYITPTASTSANDWNCIKAAALSGYRGSSDLLNCPGVAQGGRLDIDYLPTENLYIIGCLGDLWAVKPP